MATGPKWSRGALEAINNMYVVRNGLLFEYYPFSVIDFTEKDKFIKFEISPGIISPGIAVVEGNFYDVSLDDLFRRRINVGKRHIHAADDNVGRRTSSKKSKESRVAKEDSDKSRFSEVFGDEVSEAADVAFEDQVDSLLQTILAKEGEEFEITGTTQSRRVNESSTVSDIFEAT
jgi:hypothetical protein